jgi:hypothetical protein
VYDAYGAKRNLTPHTKSRSRFKNSEALAKPLWGVCKREVRIQKTGVRIIGHVAHERFTILNSEYWLLNTAPAEPTKEVLQAPL